MSIERYRHPLWFYGLSLTLPALLWSIAGRLSHLASPGPNVVLLSTGLGLVGLCAPAAIAAWFIFRDPELRRDLLGRVLNFSRINPVYLILTAGLMLCSLLAAMGISLFFGYSPGQFAVGRGFSFSAGAVPTWFILLLAPLIEELAWHSYGTDCLRRKFSLFGTTLIFAAFWVVWHMPLALIKGYYQANLVAGGWLQSLNFAVGIFPFVILMNWLYMRTGRNILVAIVFHITASFFGELFPASPDSKVIQTALLLALAVIVLVRERRLFFGRELTAD